MATTTNYSWTTPDDTALVKDGAAAIRSLGTAIDTTVFNNAGAAIAKTIVDAKGDIIAATASDTVSRLAVGANDTVLTADSSTATGLKWAAVPTGGMTLLASGTLSGSTTDLTSISGSYVNLFLVLNDFYPSTNSSFKIRCNSLTTGYLASGTYNNSGGAGVGGSNDDQIGFTESILSSSQDNLMILEIMDYTNTIAQKWNRASFWYTNTASVSTVANWGGKIATTSAITSIQIITNSGTWSAGSYKLYGVK